LKFEKLVKEGAEKIKVASVIASVPSVAPPDIVAENFVWLVRRVAGDYLLAGGVAFSVIELAAVAKTDAGFLVTFKTESVGFKAEFFEKSGFPGSDFK